MSVVRVGTTKKFADNWDNIFGGKKKSATGKDSPPKSSKSSKKSPKKLVAKLLGKKRSAKKKARLQGK